MMATHSSGTPASVAVSARCYLVGQKVSVTGGGFSAAAPFDIAVDGVDFGQSLTDANGNFASAFSPGGLGAGQAQITDLLRASDGTASASTRFTVTRRTGALFGAGQGSSPRRRVPFQVWDFAPTGPEVPVYLHYVQPDGKSRVTVALGTTTGQCGQLISTRHELFPFRPGAGTWTLQFDTSRAYSRTVAGKLARLRVAVG